MPRFQGFETASRFLLLHLAEVLLELLFSCGAEAYLVDGMSFVSVLLSPLAGNGSQPQGLRPGLYSVVLSGLKRLVVL